MHADPQIIAKLDRLARNVRFIAGIMDSGAEFVACDLPHANRLTMHLMAAMAEHEAAAISERTKAALAAAKARGVKLGNPRGAEHLLATCKVAAARSAAVRRTNARAYAETLLPTIQGLASEGITGAPAVTKALNERKIPARSGGIWHAEQARRLLRALELDVANPPG